MNKKLTKGLITLAGIALVSGGIMLAANTNTVKDITPPYGKIAIRGATEKNNVNYVDSTSVVVEIFAEDDICENTEIKYYLSTTPISTTEKISDNLWKNYYEGATETVLLPDITSTNTIYAAFKDKAGNTSTIYTGGYTITYDANGGTNAPQAQEVNYGMPTYLTNQKPVYEGKYFVGWSPDKYATTAEYYQGDFIQANALEKNTTLYAVWTYDVDKLPTLAEKVKVGDYVNYPVYYDNIQLTNGIASLNGWRVLSIENDGTVNLVSAGIPLSYYHHNNSGTTIKNLLFNFIDTPFSTSTTYTFRQSGFNPYKTLKEVFDNKYTAKYESTENIEYTTTYEDGTKIKYTGTKNAGDLKVRSITKEDVDKIYDPTGKTVAKHGENVMDNPKFEKMIAILNTNDTPTYTSYLLASAHSAFSVKGIGGKTTASFVAGSEQEFGIRPVVSLKANVKTTGYDVTGTWNIEVE